MSTSCCFFLTILHSSLLLLLLLLLPSSSGEKAEPDRIQLTSVSPGSTLSLTCTIIRPDGFDTDAGTDAGTDGEATDGVDEDFMNYVWRREFGSTRREEIFLGNLRQTTERWKGSKYDLVAGKGVYDLLIKDVSFEDAGEYR